MKRTTCFTKVKALIRAECATYDPIYCNISHYCFDPRYSLNRKCSYFCEEPESCEFFEEAVLPLDPVLGAAYEDNFCVPQYRPGMYDDSVKTKTCECGKVILASGNRSKFCSACREKKAKEQRRKWAAKKRAESRKIED